MRRATGLAMLFLIAAVAMSLGSTAAPAGGEYAWHDTSGTFSELTYGGRPVLSAAASAVSSKSPECAVLTSTCCGLQNERKRSPSRPW